MKMNSLYLYFLTVEETVSDYQLFTLTYMNETFCPSIRNSNYKTVRITFQYLCYKV